MSRLARILHAPRHAWQLLSGGMLRLDRVLEESRRGVKVGQEVLKRTEAVERSVGGMDDDLGALREDVRALRRELHDRLLQYHLQLGRLARAVEAGAATEEPRLSGRTVPVDAGAASGDPPWDGAGPGAADPEDAQWQTLAACPFCGDPDRTVVCPWNKFILLESAPDPSSARYDYAVCHGCGVLYATRRPTGARYRFLLERFGEVTAKRAGGQITNLLLDPEPLTDEGRERLRRLAARGVFVSDHLALRKHEYLAPLLRDRLANSMHTDVIGALLEPRGWRVLEVRSRAGTILDGLRRAWGADVYAMPIWESQQFLLREVYGIETSDVIDFDRFAIPFDGRFDLIICNHMLTHALRPDAFFDVLAAKLSPAGHLYFHNDPDDAEFLSGTQSMLASMNPLHMQAFDQGSVRRALEARGFRMVFQTRQQNGGHCCLAARDGAFEPGRQSDAERDARVEAYRRAFDSAVLRVEEGMRSRVAAAWPAAVERAVATGVAEFDARGRLRIVAR